METTRHLHILGDSCPVEQVSWNDIQDFINKLNQRQARTSLQQRQNGNIARSGGQERKYAGTNNESELRDYAWYGKNSATRHILLEQKTQRRMGYDMSGNVWEWVNDWHDSDYYKKQSKG